MARRSKTGVQGLSKQVHHFDSDGNRVSAANAKELRAAGAKVRDVEIWQIDLEWRAPDDQGRMVRKRYTKKLPLGIKAAGAKYHATKILNAIADGTFNPDSDAPVTVDQAITKYLEWAKVEHPAGRYESRAKQLRALLGKRRLDELSPFHVEGYKRDRAGMKVQKRCKVDGKWSVKDGSRPVGAPGINREVSMLKHLCTMARRWGWISADRALAIREVAALKESPGRVRSLTAKEEALIFGALPCGLQRLALAADLSGMRRAEVALLKRSAVDLRARSITLTRTKSNRVRTIPMRAELHALLSQLLEERGGADGAEGVPGDAYVFLSERGTPYTPDSVSRGFKRACGRVGITDLHFHDLRHDFATRLRRSGVGIDAIAHLLGHAEITTSARYAHVETKLLREAIEGMTAPAIPVPFPFGAADAPTQQPKTDERLPPALSSVA